MNVLLLDIETAPLAAYVWGLFDQNISPEHVIDTSYVMCWSAKWLGEDRLVFDKVKDSSTDRKPMLAKIHGLLDKADVVIHYNGKRFDIPVLNREFLLHKIKPPAPYKQIDLYQTFKGRFRFESNKLDNVSRRLELGYKVKHAGFRMWTECMRGDRAAWRQMEEYNRQDVALLENLYKRVLPWIPNHPSHDAFSDVACCPHCGSEKFQRRGVAITQVMKYPRYQCQAAACGRWFRGNKTVSLRRLEKMVNIPG